jgi:hypothetical protein
MVRTPIGQGIQLTLPHIKTRATKPTMCDHLKNRDHCMDAFGDVFEPLYASLHGFIFLLMLPGTIELGLEVVSSQSSALKLTQR